MPSKDASAQKANREKLKAEKEERRRLGRERANESRKRRRANPELHAVEFEVEATTSIEVEEKEDWAPPDAKWRQQILTKNSTWNSKRRGKSR